MKNDRGPADGDVSNAYTKPTMAIREVREYTSNIVGRMKTILDATITDPDQRKALKDLVHNQIWNDSYMKVVDWAQVEADIEKKNIRTTFPFRHSFPDIA